MKFIKKFESFLGGDNEEIERNIGIETDDLAAVEWWNNLSKERKREIEDEQRTLVITNSNIKRLYSIYV